MTARVLYRDAQGRTGEVQLSLKEPCYIGRALDCAVRTDDAMVSRKHSLIRMKGGRFFVEDLGSSNGTHVNDVKVSRHSLTHNDVVRCGNLWLRYIDDAPMASAAGAANTAESAAHPLSHTLGISANSALGKRAQYPQAPIDEKNNAKKNRSGTELIHGVPKLAVSSEPVTARESDSNRAASDSGMHTMLALGAIPAVATGGHVHGHGEAEPSRVGSASLGLRSVGRGSEFERDELERRLEMAVTRGVELESGLLSLQAEFRAAQQKIDVLLKSVQELTKLK